MGCGVKCKKVVPATFLHCGFDKLGLAMQTAKVGSKALK